MQVEQIERRHIPIAAALIAAGADAHGLVDDTLAEFDAALNHDPTVLSEFELMRREAGVL
jgi:hypothetical protein